jgi:A/G-specific adenine glycosylase
MGTESKLLKTWYLENKRPLPWRENKDPYRIWISEMMLQQTTVTAVIPYYERFLKKFPTVETLKKAPLSDVLEMWSGLGYYSRARNIHKAAQVLGEKGFPKSYKDLIELPGFGPYTARAVSSLAFGEKVGVVDGNVIRVLSRYFGWSTPWWTTKDRETYQKAADALVQTEDPSVINQAMMELGATICTPQSPACLLCPLRSGCVGLKDRIAHELPLKKPKKKSEIWIWEAEIHVRKNEIGLITNNYLPFLKGQFIFPGVALKQSKKPQKYDVKHGITHHEIYVRVKPIKSKAQKDITWTSIKDVHKINPSSLLRKILQSQGLA